MLVVLMGVYVAVFGVLTVRQQARYGTFGFDMGIHDQGIWLLSRFRTPFVTVRGLHYFGHHLNLVCLLLVPAYWLGAGPTFLYLVETVALASAALPVYLLGRDALPSARWAPLVPAAAYLLHPTTGWINWWHFHPETLAVAPLLWAVWLGRRERWGWFAVAVAFALSTKEDIALAVGMLGLVLVGSAWWRSLRSGSVRPRRWWSPGLLTTVAGFGWYVLATQVLMPHVNGGAAPFYVQEFFPQFGTTAPEVVRSIATHPSGAWRLLLDGDRLAYDGRLLAPSGFLAVLGLPFLLLAAPQVLANSLSALSTTYDARFHYAVVPLVGIAAGTTAGLGLLRRWHRAAAAIGLALLLASSVWTHVEWSPSPLGRPYRSGIWAGPNPAVTDYDRALARVPRNGTLATNYYLVPHATHRAVVYEWPNPWIPGNWGFADRDPDDPAGVDWLVLDLRIDQEPELRAQLTSGPTAPFTVVSDDGAVLVARRRQPSN